MLIGRGAALAVNGTIRATAFIGGDGANVISNGVVGGFIGGGGNAGFPNRVGGNHAVVPDGVALAAIQGLNQKVEEKERRILALERELTALKELVSKLVHPRE